MSELIIVIVVGVGLYRGRGRRWEWSRHQLGRAVEGLRRHGRAFLVTGRRRVPGIMAQCVDDVRSLLEDTAGLLDPDARRRIREQATGLLARRRTPGRSGATRLAVARPAGPAGVAMGGGRGDRSADRRLAQLQRRYLEGSITLEQYIEEAGELPTG